MDHGTSSEGAVARGVGRPVPAGAGPVPDRAGGGGPRRAGRRAALALAGLLAAGGAAAGEREALGWSYAIGNDSIGQARDRWQSSQLMGSVFFGPPSAAPRALAPGRLLELRLSHRLVTPERLDAPAPDDRPFAGAFALELFTHGTAGGTEVSLGGGVVATGPGTGTFRAQRWLHERLGYPLPETEGREVGDGLHLSVVAEAGRSFGTRPAVRPFVELRGGVETLARAGVDLTWGAFGTRRVTVREPVTGQRVAALWGPREEGLSVTAGIDAAAVGASVFLPDDGVGPEPRLRVRGGLRWQGERWSVHYGAAWLSPEFEGQREGQVLGLLQVAVEF
jgi:hypothetical protein